MPDERAFGPAASLHFALLNEEQRELFTWFTQKLVNMECPDDAVRFGSLLQAVACRFPEISYWSAVKAVKQIASLPDFAAVCAAEDAKAAKVMSTPPEA